MFSKYSEKSCFGGAFSMSSLIFSCEYFRNICPGLPLPRQEHERIPGAENPCNSRRDQVKAGGPCQE